MIVLNYPKGDIIYRMKDEGKMEELKKKLDSTSGDLPKMKHVKMHEHHVSVNRDWDDEEGNKNSEPIEENKKKEDPFSVSNLDNRANRNAISEKSKSIDKNSDASKIYSFLKGLTVFSIVFLIIAAGVAYYYFTINPNIISGSNIELSVSGPIIISAGQELSLDVNVFNNNSDALEDVDLIMTYPDGTRRADDKITSLVTDRIPLGTIAAGGTQRTSVKSIILGEEGSTKNLSLIHI